MTRWLLDNPRRLFASILTAVLAATLVASLVTVVRLQALADDAAVRALRTPALVDRGAVAPGEAAAELVQAWSVGDVDTIARLAAPDVTDQMIDQPAPPGTILTGPAQVRDGGELAASVQVPTSVGVVALTLVSTGTGRWQAQSFALGS